MDPIQKAVAEMKSATRMADKKAAALSLIDYLSNDTDDICQKLDFNSVNPDKKGSDRRMTWSRLFTDVCEYFAKETEKSNITHANQIVYFSVVDQVFRKATSSRPWLNWSKVLDFIVGNLQRERIANLYGSSLISMLEQFLSIELYSTVIDPPAWKDLIGTLLKCFKKYSIPTNSLLNCLKRCIAHGSLHPKVIHILRSDVVDFYARIVKQDHFRHDIIPFLQGVTILCKDNAIEFRGILCKLGELIIPAVLQVQSVSEEEEWALVEFFLVQYRLHMPYDVDMNSTAFYADSTAKWKEILKLLYSYCIDTIEEIAHRRTTLETKDLYQGLLLLAAKCTKQISASSGIETENSEEMEDFHRKKKMRYKSFHTIISEVCTKKASEGLTVWMRYLTAVLNDFPELIGSRTNLSNLIHLGSSLFNTNFMLKREFYLYFCSVLQAEKHLRVQNHISDWTDTWNTVWELTIKSLSICEDKSGAIKLLRNILKLVHPTNITCLLTVYINSSMPLSKDSVQLLAEYLSVCSLPGQISSSDFASPPAGIIDEEVAVTTSPRLGLIRWMVKVSAENISGFEELVAHVMCSLTVKQSHTLIQEQISMHPQKKSDREEFERILLRCCFAQQQIKQDDCRKISSNKPHFDFIVEQREANTLAAALQMDFDALLKFSSADRKIMLQKMVSKMNLYLHLLNVLEKYSIGEHGSSQPNGLRGATERVFDAGMQNLNEFLVICLQDRNILGSPAEAAKLIETSRALFSSDNFCDKMSTMLSHRIGQQLQELLKKIFRSNLARYVERTLNNPHETNALIDEDLPSRLRIAQHSNAVELDLITRSDRRCEKASMEALHFLIDFGTICHHRLEIFTELLKDLLLETFYSVNQFLFDASANLISKLSKIITSPGLFDLICSVVELLQKCCKGFYQLPHCKERLWILCQEMTNVVAPVDNTNRSNFMILVGTLYEVLRTSRGIPITKPIFKRAFETFGELAKNDRTLSWTEFTPVKSPPVWVLDGLHQFLESESQQVRLHAVDTICLIYECASPFDYSGGINSSQDDDNADAPKDMYQDRRKSYLDFVFQKLVETFDVDVDLSSDVISEESINRTSLVLSCLSRLIFAFPYLQNKTVMFVFMMVKVKNINVHLANRALQYSSPTSAKTMCCYFSYILKQWLKLKHTVEELPYQFFGCENLNVFFTRFRNEICVEFFERDRSSDLEQFAVHFNLGVKQLIEHCYGLIMARLIPGLTVHSQRLPLGAVNVSQFNEIHKRLIITLGGKSATETLIVTCLGDVVLNLISLTFEPTITNDWNCSDVRLAEPVPPHYPESKIVTCFKFLQSTSPYKQISVIGYLAKSSPNSIYKILLAVAIRIHDAHDELEKFWRLHQFSFFVNLLLDEPKEIFLTMKEFACSFVFNTYLRLLKMDEGKKVHCIRFRKVLVHLLTKLVERVTRDYEDEMVIFFKPVVRGIVASVVKCVELMEMAKPLLDVLMKKNRPIFTACIESLDPFPSQIVEFHEYHLIQQETKYGTRRNEWPLQREFEKCLEEMDSDSRSCTVERLRFLKELLSQRKRDLERMVKNLESKRFSDECAADPLHGIIQMLVGATLSSNDEEVILEASRCLGEIGPIDLSVLVLPVFKNQGKISDMDDALQDIIKILSEYLISEDIRLVAVSGRILRSLCEYEECARVLNTDLHTTRLYKILLPFRYPQKQTGKKSLERIDATMLEAKLGLNEMNENIDYKNWIIHLTSGIIECFKSTASFATDLLPLCELRIDFCENVLPLVVCMCLNGGKTNPLVKRIVSGYFRNFFSKFILNLTSSTDSSRSFTPSSSGTTTTCIYMNKLALRSLIRVIQFLRKHPLPQEIKGNVKLTPWDSNFWLDVNYLDVAKAAQFCGAYLTSILYVEIAATEMDMSTLQHYSDDDDDSQDQIFSQGSSMYPRNRLEASKMEILLLKAYSSIGEADAAYGCGSARYTDIASSMNHLEHTMDWHRLLLLSNGSSADTESCQEPQAALAFKQLGLYNILWTFLKGVESMDTVLQDDMTQVQYECGWRLTKWNLNTSKPVYIKDVVQSSANSAFHMCIYDSIQTGLSQDRQQHFKTIKDGFRSVHHDLRHATLESSENIYPFLSRLQMLRVVEDFFPKETGLELNVDAFIHKWKLQDRISSSDFKYQEPIMFLRNVLLRAYDTETRRANLEMQINDSLLDLIAKARDAGRLDFADGCATLMASVSSKPSTPNLIQREYEVAMNHWARGNEDVARHIMNRLIKKSSHEDDLYPNLLLLYGEWLSISHCERPAVILEKYLQRSCSIYEKRSGAPLQEVSKAHIVLAKYADAQYQNVTKYIGSDLFQAKKNHLERAKKEEEEMKIANLQDNDSRRSAIIIKKQSNYDSEEMHYIYNEQKKFLLLALRHYLRGLRVSTEQDLLIFRAISLWLENGTDTNHIHASDIEEDATKIFRAETMPSYKYIVVLHQLSARLGSKSEMMNTLLKEILLRCAAEHPYHTLPVLLTQANLHKDENVPKKSSTSKVQLAGRVQAATQIVSTLKAHKSLKSLVQRMEAVWLSLIHLANFQDGSGRNTDGVQKNIPNNISKILVNLNLVAVPTSTIPVLPSGNYKESVIGIHNFGTTYTLVGGINSPKKITCQGSNGICYNMLLKGQDDLRQDAVMQQVFGVMNKLLEVEPKTRSRRLHIRTYKVIPLSQRTGLIEWVENTQTLGDYLVGSNLQPGAHVRYRPTDYKPTECRAMMMADKNCGDLEKKHQTYMKICDLFKPVFRHFFFENFKEAGIFFEKRLAYTRSVATTSIVGYILGLGDRHVLNILIDKTTAEFIHIDLGVAFEQGRILPTPETVPFRLTRDVIDGMGMSGVEGVFKKSCEMTMDVLRNNSEIILTVLQVLLYDPLYMWTLTTDRVAKVQPSDSGKGSRKSKSNVEPAEDSVKERNNSAARVLLRLKQKLMGIEEEGGSVGAISSGSSLSINGHVSLLIQRAIDPDKLCRLFSGWQPYL